MGGWAYFEFAYICCRNFCLKTAYFRGWNKNYDLFQIFSSASLFLASGSRFCHWELILTVRVIFLPRRVNFEQVAVGFDPVSQLRASGIDFLALGVDSEPVEDEFCDPSVEFTYTSRSRFSPLGGGRF